MTMKTMGVSVGVALFAGLATAGGVYALQQWRASQPSLKNFESVVKAQFEKSSGASARSDAANGLCLSLSSPFKPDARTQSRRQPNWSIDYHVQAGQESERSGQLQQLDALSAAGLLEREAMPASAGSDKAGTIRYRLTSAGWRASRYQSGEPCLVYAVPRYLGVTRWESKTVQGSMTLEAQLVYFNVGLASEAELADWARSKEIQAVFPQIPKAVRTQEQGVYLVQGGRGWETLDKSSRRKRGEIVDGEPGPGGQHKLPPPAYAELEQLLMKSHGHTKTDDWPGNCLYLPGGTEKLPVDDKFFSYKPERYSVGISWNKDRRKGDRITGISLPYLQRLEQLGVVQRLSKDSPKAILGMDVYELTPRYAPAVMDGRPYCLPLGPATVEVVDIRIFDQDDFGREASTFKYKLRIYYKNPPAWAQDPQLVSGWPELRGTLERGRACQGSFEFERNMREKQGGAGTCWWAYESVESEG